MKKNKLSVISIKTAKEHVVVMDTKRGITEIMANAQEDVTIRIHNVKEIVKHMLAAYFILYHSLCIFTNKYVPKNLITSQVIECTSFPLNILTLVWEVYVNLYKPINSIITEVLV